MAYLEQQLADLKADLQPAAAYVKRAREKFDPDSPNAAGQVRHIKAVEQAVQGAIDFARIVDKFLNPLPDPFIARVRAHLAEPQLVARMEQPAHIREALAAYTAHCLPRNPLLDEIRRPV